MIEIVSTVRKSCKKKAPGILSMDHCKGIPSSLGYGTRFSKTKLMKNLPLALLEEEPHIKRVHSLEEIV
ncbi:Uncharacterized protein APZ42_028607 [Daphnia magna]|uniref:Uncharacterized protein n=1 Tax=Daphnia magna TaxID=35525 RepID=A0A164Q6T2_9CRUS|nr:Uncharacterized protein APZ42_028607 [Daphnia magna]